MKHYRFLVIALLALLTGCAGVTPREVIEGQGDAAQWRAHRQQLSALDAWQISGKVGIQSEQSNGSGTLFWLQRRDYFDIRLAGPLGQGSTRLTGREGAVVLEVANKGRFEAASPEALLEAQLGWRLPVSHLLWWIRGLPAPDTPSQLTLDSASHLARLEQEGWRVEYGTYQQQNGFWLPERLRLEGRAGQRLDVTVVIKEWQPRQLGQ
ncbi:MAG: lipoprotein insertase outer membrane protein LolB [Pseudomonas sp.]